MTTGLLNPTHIILLLLVALIILGPKRLPQAGRSLGRGMREFRDGITGHDEPPEQAQINTHAAPPSAVTQSGPIADEATAPQPNRDGQRT